MQNFSRRNFLAALGITGAAALIPSAVMALPAPVPVVPAHSEIVSFNELDLEMMGNFFLQQLAPKLNKSMYPEFADKTQIKHMLAVTLRWYDDEPSIMREQMQEVADLMARECNTRELSCFGIPVHLQNLSNTASVCRKENNTAARLVKMYDIMENMVSFRIDVCGY